jgi:hypothetical protein
MPKCEDDSKTMQGFTGSNQQRRTIKDCLHYSATNGSLLYCIVYLALIFEKQKVIWPFQLDSVICEKIFIKN